MGAPFSPNLAATRESMSPQDVPEGIFKNFCLGSLAPKNVKLKDVEQVYLTLTSIQPTERTAEQHCSFYVQSKGPGQKVSHLG